MRSRASRAVTTAEPSSSPTSAQRPGKASSWAMRCHCRASTYRHMSRGYQARRARARLSSPGPSWKTVPAVISASRWVGAVEPVRGRDGRARVEPQLAGQPRGHGRDLHPVPGLASGFPGHRERRGVAAEHRRQAPGEHRGDLARAAAAQQDQQPRAPVVVGGALGVVAEHLRARSQQGRGVRQPRERLIQQRAHGLVVERLGQLQARDERAAVMPTILPGLARAVTRISGRPPRATAWPAAARRRLRPRCRTCLLGPAGRAQPCRLPSTVMIHVSLL